VWARAQEAQIWSYLATGAEREALQALLDAHNLAHSDAPMGVRIITGNTAEMRRAMQVAFLGGNPPAAYQSGIGHDLKAFLDAGRIANIQNVVGDVEGVAEISSGIKRVVSFDGEMYGVPLNIHIISNLFYNKAIFDELGLVPPKTVEEFRSVAEKLRAAGYQVLGNAFGSNWTSYTTFPFLYEQLGYEGMFAFVSGEVAFTDPRVKVAFQEWTDSYVSNFMDDWAGYSWADTAAQFVQGNVAMYQMGDWLSAYLADSGWSFDEEYGVFPVPGLGDAVIGQIDVLSKPTGLSEDIVKIADLFLQTAAGPQAQLAFNVRKGAIAVNPRAHPEGYSPYSVFAREQIMAATAADRMIPNPKFLLPTELDEEIGNDVVSYAQAPSSEALDAMLIKLDGLRQRLIEEGKFVRW